MTTRLRTEPAFLGLCFALAGHAHAAPPEPPRASIVVTRGPGAEGCPDTVAVAERIRPRTSAEVLGSMPDASPDTWIQVELSHQLWGFRAVISARGRRQGTRTIEDVGDVCDSLADAVAITLEMLLDPEHPPAAAPAPSAPATKPPERPSAPAPPRSTPKPWLRLGAEAAGGAGLGVLYHATPLVELGPRLGLGGAVTLSAGGGFVFPDRAPFEGRSIELGLWYAYLRGSVRLLDNGATDIALTGGPLLGSLSGDGRGFPVHRVQRIVWGAVGAGGEVSAVLGPSFAWFARVLALAALLDEGFSVVTVGGPVRAFRTSSLGATLTVGVRFTP